MSKVMVGLSGGVDSAVSALLLKQQGHDVRGVYMQNWEMDQDDPYCSAEKDLQDAKVVADHIGIPIETVNFSKQYMRDVFQHCLDEFSAGRTPNPDVLCNRDIKFKALLDYVLQAGADYLATGHYARTAQSGAYYTLQKGIDLNKDQSYFLYLLNQHALAHSLFPLGTLTKAQVREIAKTHQLPNHDKKDSTGICFIGERKFSTFLKEFLLTQPGPIKTIEGITLGQHEGLMFYTLGQRKGLNIGGQKAYKQDPWYVLDKNIEQNTLVIGQGQHHQQLYHNQLTGDQLHWIDGSAPKTPIICQAKTRYRQEDQDCKLTPLKQGKFGVTFDQAQRAITPGQSIVFYNNTVCLGGGIIQTRTFAC